MTDNTEIKGVGINKEGYVYISATETELVLAKNWFDKNCNRKDFKAELRSFIHGLRYSEINPILPNEEQTLELGKEISAALMARARGHTIKEEREISEYEEYSDEALSEMKGTYLYLATIALSKMRSMNSQKVIDDDKMRRIFKLPYDYESKHDNVFEGLKILSKYCKDDFVITYTGDNKIFSQECGHFMHKGITEEECRTLRQLGWFVAEDGCLGCNV